MKILQDKFSLFSLKFLVLNLTGTIFLYFIAKTNYLLFHSMSEGFSIIVAGLIYVLATKTYKHSKDNYILFLGISYFFIAVLDFLHLISYKGMTIYSEVYSYHFSSQLWVAGRFLESLSLVIAPFFITRTFSRINLYITYGLTAFFLIISIFGLQIFPICFLEGEGLTSFNITCEIIFGLAIAVGILFLHSRKRLLDPMIFRIILFSMHFTLFSKIAFTLHDNPYGEMSFIGHLLKIDAYFLIYQGIVIKGLEAPYEMIFKKLKETSITDYLTGLYNRQGFMEFAEIELKRNLPEGHSIGIMLLDLDDFKNINDRYGHGAGDQVLKQFSELFKAAIPKNGLASRLGGDEFAIIMTGTSCDFTTVRLQIKNIIQNWSTSNEMVRGMGVSIGIAIAEPGHQDINELLRKADQNMYDDKNQTKLTKQQYVIS